MVPNLVKKNNKISAPINKSESKAYVDGATNIRTWNSLLESKLGKKIVNFLASTSPPHR